VTNRDLRVKPGIPVPVDPTRETSNRPDPYTRGRGYTGRVGYTRG